MQITWKINLQNNTAGAQLLTSQQPGRKNREREGWGPSIPLPGHAPSDLTSSHLAPPLKTPPSCESTHLLSKPRPQWPHFLPLGPTPKDSIQPPIHPSSLKATPPVTSLPPTLKGPATSQEPLSYESMHGWIHWGRQIPPDPLWHCGIGDRASGDA
jgi:hypothetical protein